MDLKIPMKFIKAQFCINNIIHLPLSGSPNTCILHIFIYICAFTRKNKMQIAYTPLCWWHHIANHTLKSQRSELQLFKACLTSIIVPRIPVNDSLFSTKNKYYFQRAKEMM